MLNSCNCILEYLTALLENFNLFIESLVPVNCGPFTQEARSSATTEPPLYGPGHVAQGASVPSHECIDRKNKNVITYLRADFMKLDNFCCGNALHC